MCIAYANNCQRQAFSWILNPLRQMTFSHSGQIPAQFLQNAIVGRGGNAGFF